MINIVYIDDQLFTGKYTTYEDTHDFWKYSLIGINVDQFNLFLFDDPKECIEKIKSLGNNTILLLDIQMELQQTDGAKVLKEIRDNNITIPVIGYSGNKENEKNDRYLVSLLENDLFGYVQKKTGNEPELIEAINKAIEKFKDNIPLELTEALGEYLERYDELKDAKILIQEADGTSETITFSEIQEHINKGTLLGKDYQKALYKIAFEDLKKQKKAI